MSSNGNPGYGPSTPHNTPHNNDEGGNNNLWRWLAGIAGVIALAILIGFVISSDDSKKSPPVTPAKVASKVTPTPPAKPDKQGAAPVPVDCNTLTDDTKFGTCVLNDASVRPAEFEDKDEEWNKVVRTFAPVVRAALDFDETRDDLDQFEGCHEAYVLKRNDGRKNALCQRLLQCITAPADEAAICFQTGTRTNAGILVEIN
ncbi:MAG: hypothetical protein KBD29_01735 [Candidatus Magasanikbacteria bacterium]|nr:hypothetical protein [Candidatus Magasanikbacteria bacterium]